jgi:hypothetical protein
MTAYALFRQRSRPGLHREAIMLPARCRSRSTNPAVPCSARPSSATTPREDASPIDHSGDSAYGRRGSGPSRGRQFRASGGPVEALTGAAVSALVARGKTGDVVVDRGVGDGSGRTREGPAISSQKQRSAPPLTTHGTVFAPDPATGAEKLPGERSEDTGRDTPGIVSAARCASSPATSAHPRARARWCGNTISNHEANGIRNVG